MADRIVVMKDGVIQQIGSPIKLYNEPVNKFVAGVIGSPLMNFIEVNVKDDVVEFNDGKKIHLTKGMRDRLQKSGKMILGVRGEDIKFDSLNMELRKDDILKATAVSYTHLPWKAIVGTNMFRHESGIHADGALKDPKNYEAFDPAEVGLQRQIVIGKHSGKAAIVNKFKEYSIELTNEEANQILEEVRKVSVGLKRELFDKELDVYKRQL